jgi:hypothetical protein
MLTINKLTKALESIREESARENCTVGLIYVIANETLKETAPEIENIKANAS